MRPSFLLALACSLVAVPFAIGCGDDDGGSMDGGPTDSGPSDAAAGGGGETTIVPPDLGPCVVTLCPGQSNPFECGDCQDNDMDGAADTGRDPDCLGPCDNNEAGYDLNLTGSPQSSCRVDCYYDSNSGASENCDYSLVCDPLEPRVIPGGQASKQCEYVGDANFDTESVFQGSSCGELIDSLDDTSGGASCADLCTPLTPPGCDCFGCCELPARSGNFVFIGTEDASGERPCTFAEAEEEFEMSGGDPDSPIQRQCRLCTPVDTCFTTCERCRLCLGQTELPVSCFDDPGTDGGIPDRCPGGVQPCGLEGDAPCDSAEECFFGCCEDLSGPL